MSPVRDESLTGRASNGIYLNNMNGKRDNTILLILGLLVLIAAIFPIFENRFIDTHDVNLYPTWLYEFDQGIKAGHFLPRWSNDFWLGYGVPLFNFIQPLFYYLSELAHLVGFGLLHSIKLVIVLGFGLGFLSMYLLGKEIWKDKRSGFICAVIFTFFPYRLGLVYIRGDFTEFLATSLIPLVLFAFMKLGEKRNLGFFLLSSFSLALLLLAHNIQTVLFIPVLLVYLLIFFGKEIKKVFWPFFFSGITSLGIASFFILPAFFEKKFLEISLMYSGQYDFHAHFLKVMDLFNLKWDSDHFFQIGITGIVIFFFIIYALLKKSFGLPKKNVYFFLILAVISIIASLSVSAWFWESIPLFKFVQYPWRALSFLALALSVLSGVMFRTKVISLFFKKKTPWFISVSTLAIVVILVNLFFAQPASYLKIESDEAYNPYSQIFSEANLETSYQKKKEQMLQLDKLNIYTLIPEFVPKGTNIQLLTNQVAGTMRDQLRAREEFRILKIEVLSGQIEWAERPVDSYNYSFEITANEESSIRVNNFWFPGWRAFLDGQETEIKHDNDFQAMVFDIPNGSHMLQLKFGNTMIRTIGEIISAVSLAVWFLLLIIFVFRKVFFKRNDQFSATT